MSRSLNKKTLSITVIALAVLFFVVPHKAAAFSIIDIGADFVSHFLAISYEVFILPLASGIMYLAGILFDAAVQFSLHTAYIFKLSPAINLGWVIVRDLSNMFFIFILIFISLGTIINGTRFGTMNMLKNVVIAALFINFSLFLTKAAVDVSNIFGNWLYGGINKTLVVNSVDRTKPTSLSGLIANRLGIINLWKVSNHATGNKSDGNWINNPGKSIIGASLRLIIVLITIYIFIYCAILFLARSVTILFLLIFSPIAFMGLVLPQLKKYANQWLDELWNAMLFPVMFLLVLYISLQFINSLGSLGI